MAREYRYLAFDLGAESGRAVLGTLSKEAKTPVVLEEIHRFPTKNSVISGTRQWDVFRIHGEMLAALTRVAQEHGPHLDGIAVDTWGVDFGLLSAEGALVANPVHYRDHRTDGILDHAFERVPRDEIYRETGIQLMQINTAFQLLSMVLAESPLLDKADALLMMNDVFTHMLSGRRVCEYTNASTTQLLDPHKKTWHEGLIDRLGLPRRIFMDPTPPATVVGTLLPEIAQVTGLDTGVPVVAAAGHDTACAVAAAPCAESEDWAYLSSGTWSLLGVELDAPHITEESLACNFTNEGGVCDTIRFLKNVTGLWLVQECRRAWEQEGSDVGYAELAAEAEDAAAFASLIDVDEPGLLAPDDMPAAIRKLCRESGQPEPTERGGLIRCVLESLALKYRQNLRNLDRMLDRQTRRLHIIGGGVQNRLLCQMTADACGVPVWAGPVEATSLGNIVVQAMATGVLGSLDEARAVIARSVMVEQYEPRAPESWDQIAAATPV